MVLVVLAGPAGRRQHVGRVTRYLSSMDLANWSWKQRAGVGAALVLLLALAAGAGYFAAPTKTTTITVTRDVVRVEYRDRVRIEQGPVRVVTRTLTTPGPAGPTVEVIKTVEREKVVTVRDSSGTTTSDSQASTTRVEERDAPRLQLSATAAIRITAPQEGFIFGGQLDYRVAGPLHLGIGFNTRLEALVLVGVSL